MQWDFGWIAGGSASGALLTLACLVACSDGPSEGGNGNGNGNTDLAPCLQGGLDVQLGTGSFEFFTLQPGDPIVMHHGEQGGWHFDVAAIVSGSSLQVTILPSARVTSSDLMIAGDQDPWYASLDNYVEASCSGYFWGKRAIIDDHLPGVPYIDFICSLENEEVQICVSITDLLTDNTLTECILAVAVLDEDDVPECAD